jgi:hypothetical protein
MNSSSFESRSLNAVLSGNSERLLYIWASPCCPPNMSARHCVTLSSNLLAERIMSSLCACPGTGAALAGDCGAAAKVSSLFAGLRPCLILVRRPAGSYGRDGNGPAYCNAQGLIDSTMTRTGTVCANALSVSANNFVVIGHHNTKRAVARISAAICGLGGDKLRVRLDKAIFNPAHRFALAAFAANQLATASESVEKLSRLARLEGDIRCNHLRQARHDFSWKNEFHDGSTVRAVLTSFADRENEPPARSNLVDPCQCFAEEFRNAVCIDKGVISHGTSFVRRDSL